MLNNRSRYPWLPKNNQVGLLPDTELDPRLMPKTQGGQMARVAPGEDDASPGLTLPGPGNRPPKPQPTGGGSGDGGGGITPPPPPPITPPPPPGPVTPPTTPVTPPFSPGQGHVPKPVGQPVPQPGPSTPGRHDLPIPTSVHSTVNYNLGGRGYTTPDPSNVSPPTMSTGPNLPGSGGRADDPTGTTGPIGQGTSVHSSVNYNLGGRGYTTPDPSNVSPPVITPPPSGGGGGGGPIGTGLNLNGGVMDYMPPVIPPPPPPPPIGVATSSVTYPGLGGGGGGNGGGDDGGDDPDLTELGYGGIVTKPTKVKIGERGPEAVFKIGERPMSYLRGRDQQGGLRNLTTGESPMHYLRRGE